MARFGQGLIQALTNPSYQQGMFNLGSAIGSAPAQRRDQQAKSTAMTMVNEALASQDPDKLLQAANAIKTMDPATATKLSQAAGQLRTQRRQAGIAQLEQGQQETNANVQKAKAIREAVNRGDRESARLLREGLLSVEDYAKSLTTKASAKPVSISPGGALVSSTGEVLYERGFKPEAAKEPKVSFQERDDGSLLVFEGSKLVQTIEAPEKGTNQEAAMDLITKSVFLQSQVDKLIQTVPTTGSGFLGGTVGQIPGTAGYDRDRDIINIKANLGFEQINEMKRQAQEAGASGTGLGQVSNIELLALQSTVDTLDIGMGAEAQIEALGNIKNHLKTVQMLASGVAPKDAIQWDTPSYKVAGYHQDPETGDVFFAPDGPSGTIYILRDGKFVNAGL